MGRWFSTAGIRIGRTPIAQERSMIANIINCTGNLQQENSIIKTGINYSKTLSKTSATCWCLASKGNLRHKCRRTRAKEQETIKFLHLLIVNLAVKTREKIETTKYIKRRIPEMVKVTQTIQVRTCLRTQNKKSKTKAISPTHTDLIISTVVSRWETGATLMSLQLFLIIIVQMMAVSQASKGQQRGVRTPY